jgi:hypothetical protein
MTRIGSTSSCWIIALGVLLSAWPHPLRAHEDSYPALGFTLPASSVQPVPPAMPGEPGTFARHPLNPSADKLRGVQVASTDAAFPPEAGVQVAASQTAAAQLPISRTPSSAPQIPYTPPRQAAVVPQPAIPPPDFTGSRPPVGASPRGLWLVNQFLAELPVELPASPRPAGDPAATLAARTAAAANRPLGPHRLASHQQPSDPSAPSPPPLEPVPTQDPLIAPLPTPANEPAAQVEIVAGTPPANAYQPVLWPNYLEARLIPSFPPCCQPVCRPSRPPIPVWCPCH